MKKNLFDKTVAVYLAEVCLTAYLVFGKVVDHEKVADYLENFADACTKPLKITDAVSGEIVAVTKGGTSKSDIYFAIGIQEEPLYSAAGFLGHSAPYDTPEWTEWETKYLSYRNQIRGITK